MFKEIRHPRISDARQITELNESAFPISYNYIFFINAVRFFNDTFVVAVDENDNIIGHIVGFQSQMDTDLAYWATFVVAEEYHGTGVASQLMKAFEQALVDKGISRLSLMVDPKNEHAREIYLNRGFEYIRTYPDFYAPGFDRDEMELDLVKKYSLK